MKYVQYPDSKLHKFTVISSVKQQNVYSYMLSKVTTCLTTKIYILYFFCNIYISISEF